jgi:hypothetical protein
MFNQQDDISGLGHLLAWTLGREKHFEESIWVRNQNIVFTSKTGCVGQRWI